MPDVVRHADCDRTSAMCGKGMFRAVSWRIVLARTISSDPWTGPARPAARETACAGPLTQLDILTEIAGNDRAGMRGGGWLRPAAGVSPAARL